MSLLTVGTLTDPKLSAKASNVFTTGDCSLVRRFCSPKVRKSEIKGSSFRRFCSPKVRKSEIKGSSFRRFCSPKVRKSDNDIDGFLL